VIKRCDAIVQAFFDYHKVFGCSKTRTPLAPAHTTCNGRGEVYHNMNVNKIFDKGSTPYAMLRFLLSFKTADFDKHEEHFKDK
jgi:hypothetical protein